MYGADNKTRYFQAKFTSKAYGIRDSRMINVPGRVIFDVIESVQREFPLRSYTLNSVSSEFLGTLKIVYDNKYFTKPSKQFTF